MNQTSKQPSAKRLQAKNNEAALKAFMTRKAEIDTLLAELKSASDEHFHRDPDSITYADVGDLSHLANQLQDLCDRISNQGEYA